MTSFAPIRGHPPGRLGRWFLRRFATVLTVEVSPRGLRVVGPGREVFVPAGGRDGAPPLFGGSALDVPAPYERLAAALRGAVAEVLSARGVYMRPAITFRGIASLDAALGGFQAVVLTQAAFHAGAHRVEFDPPLSAPPGRR